jgi:GNAT superfamily N-acetyltransferase
MKKLKVLLMFIIAFLVIGYEVKARSNKRSTSPHQRKKLKTVVKLAEKQDAEALTEVFMRALHISMFPFTPKGYTRRFTYKKWQKKFQERISSKEWILYAAEVEGEVVGMIGATKNPHPPLEYKTMIRSLYVDPDFHGMGIGTLLFQTLIERLKKEKKNKIILWTIKANMSVRAFYTKQGGGLAEHLKLPKEHPEMPHVAYIWELVE